MTCSARLRSAIASLRDQEPQKPAGRVARHAGGAPLVWVEGGLSDPVAARVLIEGSVAGESVGVLPGCLAAAGRVEDPMSDMDCGLQPLDGLMEKWGLGNHDLVAASTEQLTHKQVQRGRHGRRLTLKMMMKVTRAFNVAIWFRLDKEQKEAFVEYGHKELFNYAKGHEAGVPDPNDALAEALKG